MRGGGVLMCRTRYESPVFFFVFYFSITYMLVNILIAAMLSQVRRCSPPSLKNSTPYTGVKARANVPSDAVAVR